MVRRFIEELSVTQLPFAIAIRDPAGRTKNMGITRSRDIEPWRHATARREMTAQRSESGSPTNISMRLRSQRSAGSLS